MTGFLNLCITENHIGIDELFARPAKKYILLLLRDKV